MDELRTDLVRAFTGLVLGVAVGTVGVAQFPSWPWWLAAPVALVTVGCSALCGAGVALVVGDWWDRR